MYCSARPQLEITSISQVTYEEGNTYYAGTNSVGADSATVNFTSSDKATNNYAGTFSGTLRDANGTGIEVVDGVFNTKN